MSQKHVEHTYIQKYIINPIKLTRNYNKLVLIMKGLKIIVLLDEAIFFKVLINETYGKKNYYNGEC